VRGTLFDPAFGDLSGRYPTGQGVTPFEVQVEPLRERTCVLEPVCHTLKYSILGCDYLLQYVHLSIGFSENFKDFSGNHFIYPRARSIFIWKALKFFFMKSKYFIWIPRVQNLPPEFSSKNFRILPDIFFLV
jgi:hypothetical protein